MAAITKFMFENSFDGRAEEVAAAAAAKRRSYNETELEAARRAAFEEGIASGRGEAERSIERRAAGALDTVARGLSGLIQRAEEDRSVAARDAVAAAAAIARKVLPTLTSRHGLAEIEGLIGECLERLVNEPRVVVRVADSMLDPLKARLDAIAASRGFAGRFVLLADPGLAEADAKVEWADGGGERITAAVWRQIDDAIRRFLDQNEAAATPAAGQS